MAKAVSSTEDDPGRELLEGAGDAVMLLVPRALVVVLSHQAEHEGVKLGVVLDRAIRDYLKKNGAPGAIEYLQELAQRRAG